jgi:hypothetical protein
MPIVSTDLDFFSVANVPTDDVATVGGAIDLTSRVLLTQFGANAVLALISDGADTRTATIAGRLTTGVADTEAVVLTNAVEKLSTKTWSVIQSITMSATDPARTVTAKQGSGGSVVATILPNEKIRHIQFQNSTSESAQADRWEKQFVKNKHATLSLLNALVSLTADPAARIKIGVGTAVNGSTTSTNRKTAPAGITFVDDNVTQAVPGTNLAAGDACPVWVQQTLPANDTAQKSTFTLQIAGSTT